MTWQYGPRGSSQTQSNIRVSSTRPPRVLTQWHMSSSTVSRLHHAVRSSSLPFLYPSRSLVHPPARRAMMSAFRPGQGVEHPPPLANSPPVVVPSTTSLSSDASAPQIAARPPPAPKVEKPRPKIQSTKAALTIVRVTRRVIVWCHYQLGNFQTSEAVRRLRNLLNGPTPQLIRIGVRNKGCAGLSYHLEYVDKPGKFDEVVEQDGVRVLIDSKALFSIIGSEMDWKEDSLRSVGQLPFPSVF